MGVVLSDRMGTNGSEMAAQHRNIKIVRIVMQKNW